MQMIDMLNTMKDIMIVFSFITGASAVIAIIISVVNRFQAPNKKQNEEIAELKEEYKQLREYLDKDNIRIREVEESNRITQKALLAIMSHEINGNDVDKLVAARNELEQHLIAK